MPRGSRRPSLSSQGGRQLPEAFTPCPVQTSMKSLPKEDEIKAYKLGKRRWSYNQCAIKIKNTESLQIIDVLDCMQYGPPTLTPREQESGVTYQVRLENGLRVRMNVFAVYDCPQETMDDEGNTEYVWPCITRNACPKGHCEGPILRTIQRFGKLGRRSGTTAEGGESVMKNAKYMFISIDEAGSHVGMRHFRMVMGMYGMGDGQLIASTISAPIRVLANNDVPSGAAFIPFTLNASAGWEGWKPDLQARLPDSLRSSGYETTDMGHSMSSRSTEPRSGHTSVHIKLESEMSAPLGEILKQHAANFSLDSDLGATRLNSAMSQQGYSINATAGPPRLPETTGHIPALDEETICFHAQMSQHNSRHLFGLDMPPGPPYSPVLSNLSGNDIVYSNGSPNLPPMGMNYITFQHVPANVVNPFQECSMMEPGCLDDWYDPELLEQGLPLELQHLTPSPQLHTE